MDIKVTKEAVSISDEYGLNENEYKVSKLNFTFSEEYTDDLTKIAVFLNDENTYKVTIVDNSCDIPFDILQKEGGFTLGVYAYKVDGEDLELRYSPTPVKVYIYDGSYVENADNESIPTPTEIEQLQSQITKNANDITSNVQNLQGQIDSLDTEVDSKQETLVSGVNIKTINDKSILGSGNINITGGAGGTASWGDIEGTLSDQTDLQTALNGKQDTLTAGENITIENNVISSAGGGTSLPTLDLKKTSEEKLEVIQQIYQNYIDGKDPNFYIMGMQGQQEMGADKYNSSDIAVLKETLTPEQTDNGKYCLKFKAFDLTGTMTWDYGLNWIPLKNITVYIYYDENGYSSWDLWYEDECFAPTSSTSILGMYNTNNYEPYDDYNPATKKYVDDGVAGVEITSNDATERHDKTLEFAKRFAKYGNCKLTTLIQNIRQANEITEIQKSTNYVKFRIWYLPKRDANDVMGIWSYYGLDYLQYVRQYDYTFYVSRSEFDNKDITEIYDNQNLSNVASGMQYSWYSSTFMTPYYSSSKVPLSINNTSTYTPTGDYNPATKKYVDDFYKSISGYDASKTQVLKNINGTLTWVDE